MAADAMAKEKKLSINKSRFKALTATCDIGDESVLLMKPQTFMNLSGDAVSQAVKFYKIPPEHVIVVSDEISLPIGKLRIRTKGSAGGHNGLKDIIAKLGTDAFPRIRIGVGAPPRPDYDMADWVLGTFQNQDAETMAEAAQRAQVISELPQTLSTVLSFCRARNSTLTKLSVKEKLQPATSRLPCML